MDHDRHAHCLERPAGQLRSSRGRRRRQGLTAHVREVDTRAFEHLAVRQYHGSPTAALGALPGVIDEVVPFGLARAQPLADAGLQRAQETQHGIPVDHAIGRGARTGPVRIDLTRWRFSADW